MKTEQSKPDSEKRNAQRCSEQQRAGNRVDGEDGKGNIMKGLVALVNLFPSCNTK